MNSKFIDKFKMLDPIDNKNQMVGYLDENKKYFI